MNNLSVLDEKNLMRIEEQVEKIEKNGLISGKVNGVEKNIEGDKIT